MKKIRTTIKTSLLVALCITAMNIVSCKKDNGTPGVTMGTTSLDQLIQQDTSLTIFAAILKKTHLDIYSKGPGPFTIFAPSNKAYLSQGITSVNDVAMHDSTFLMNKTAYQIAAGVQTSSSLVGLNVPINSTLGTAISASAYSNYTFFNGFNAVKRDIMASNGVLHIMDICLLPNTANTTTTLTQYPQMFKLFAQAIARATSGTTIVNATTTTLLAPTNNAMLSAGYDSIAIANTSAATLATLVKYHTVPTKYFAFALKTGDTKTALGKTVRLNMDITIPTAQGNGNSTPANFVITGMLPVIPTVLSTAPSINLNTSNGVVHAIDQVLKP